MSEFEIVKDLYATSQIALKATEIRLEDAESEAERFRNALENIEQDARRELNMTKSKQCKNYFTNVITYINSIFNI